MNGLLELSRVDRVELEFYEVNISKMMANSIAFLKLIPTLNYFKHDSY